MALVAQTFICGIFVQSTENKHYLKGITQRIKLAPAFACTEVQKLVEILQITFIACLGTDIKIFKIFILVELCRKETSRSIHQRMIFTAVYRAVIVLCKELSERFFHIDRKLVVAFRLIKSAYEANGSKIRFAADIPVVWVGMLKPVCRILEHTESIFCIVIANDVHYGIVAINMHLFRAQLTGFEYIFLFQYILKSILSVGHIKHIIFLRLYRFQEPGIYGSAP